VKDAQRIGVERLETRMMLTGGHSQVILGDDWVYGLAVDDAGDAYVAGEYESASGDADIVFGKYDLDGSEIGNPAFLWRKVLPSEGSDYVVDLAIDSAGSVYLAGQFVNSVNFDPDNTNTTLTSPSSDSGFIAKYSASGDFQWVQQVAGGLVSDISLIESSPGNVRAVVQGSFGQTVSIAGVEVSNTTRDSKSDYLVELNGDGEINWFRSLQSQGTARFTGGVAVNDTGIYTVLQAWPGSGKIKNVHLDQFELTQDGNPMTYLAKLEPHTGSDGVPDGAEFVWVHPLTVSRVTCNTTSCPTETVPRSLTLGPAGALYITGSAAKNTTFPLANGDIVSVTCPPKDDNVSPWNKMFVLRIDEFDALGQTNPANVWVYAPTDATTGESLPNSVATDGQGGLFVNGRFSQRLDFGGPLSMESRGQNHPSSSLGADKESDAFVLQLHDDGDRPSFVSSWHIGGPGEDGRDGSVTSLHDGRILTAGTFVGEDVAVGPQAIEFPSGTRIAYPDVGRFASYLAVIDLDSTAVEVQPAQPTNLSASVVAAGVQLSWQDDSTNAVEFIVQRGVKSTNFNSIIWQEIARTSTASYLDTSASGDVIYRVFAVDAGGNESFVSHFAIVSVSGGGGGGKGGGGKGGKGPKSNSALLLAAAAVSDSSSDEQANDAMQTQVETTPPNTATRLVADSATQVLDAANDTFDDSWIQKSDGALINDEVTDEAWQSPEAMIDGFSFTVDGPE
jgi:hypothetical protein